MELHAPLAERMRPQKADDFIGQHHLFGIGKPLSSILENVQLIHSMILWGPPGVGKTSFAHLLSNNKERKFFSFSAVDSGIRSVREVLDQARELIHQHQPSPILFLDEIHRFSKSQQDSLLSAVEKGIINLIGATTENPSFEVNNALLSRCRIYKFEEPGVEELNLLLNRAVSTDPALKSKNIEIAESEFLIQYSGGDIRRLLNALEAISQFSTVGKNGKINITNELAHEILMLNLPKYDKDGDNHYDMASALIKSIRGSDPNAALYWMFRMLAGGEDPVFICRRLIISAAEDIGLANPNALLLATSCLDAVRNIGLPEGEIPMSELIIYLATSPKSNSAYIARNKAKQAALDHPHLPVPLHLKNATDKITRQLGYGKNYKYPHSFEQNFVIQKYLPNELENIRFYQPSDNTHEEKIKERLVKWWKYRENEEKT